MNTKSCLQEAWSTLSISTRAKINELYNEGHYQYAKELENSLDHIKVALLLSGYNLSDE